MWGDEDHVRGLFGDRVSDLELDCELAPVDYFDDGAAFREFFKTNYGPTVAVYRSLADQPDRAAELDQALTELGGRYDLGGGRMEWEYLLVTARRR